MHIFLFHRDLRLNDNTTLIEQLKKYEKIVPIFIFTPEQIDKNKNKYFSNNSVQFMIESLHELSDQIKAHNGQFYFFKGATMDVLKNIQKEHKIESIAFNFDYTPYAITRDTAIKEWCSNNKIDCIVHEDYVLHDILNNTTKKDDGTPYQMFTPFKQHLQKTLKIRPINNFRGFKFEKIIKLSNNIYRIEESKLDDFYIPNKHINVHGGRFNGLKILKNINKFNEYDKKRNFLTYETTFLSAYNHFSTVSIREVYFAVANKFTINHGIINELYWRDFYVNITYFFPHILNGQIRGNNRAFRKKYDSIPWSSSKVVFDKWCKGQTGFPIIDAAQNQLNTTGFMHNRTRMCTAMFLTKDLHISWIEGEKYFAKQLVDYSPMQNNGGWQWAASTGTDAQPYFRIFNPWTQTKNYDNECEYIKTWIPELRTVPNEDILKWYDPKVHKKWLNNEVKYYAPIISHEEETKKTLSYSSESFNL